MKALFLSILLVTLQSHGQAQINNELKQQLDSIMQADQKYRRILSTLTTRQKTDSIAKIYNIDPTQVIGKLSKMQDNIDSTNLLFVEDIIHKHGYPGKTLVGPETSEVAWFVLEHSTKIGQYLPIIKQAGQNGELRKTRVAMMEDRYFMYQGKEQIYGTQGAYKTLKNGKTEMIIYPTKDPENVNKRRKEMGFETTVEENAKRMNIVYRVIKLSDIQ